MKHWADKLETDLSARVPECEKLKMYRLDLCAEHAKCNHTMTLGFKGFKLMHNCSTQPHDTSNIIRNVASYRWLIRVECWQILRYTLTDIQSKSVRDIFSIYNIKYIYYKRPEVTVSSPAEQDSPETVECARLFTKRWCFSDHWMKRRRKLFIASAWKVRRAFSFRSTGRPQFREKIRGPIRKCRAVLSRNNLPRIDWSKHYDSSGTHCRITFDWLYRLWLNPLSIRRT